MTGHGDKDVALNNEILRTVCGSGVHGMAIEGHDDNDEMGVYVELPEQVMGLARTAEHWVSRTKPEGVRSGPGDTDLTIYLLRKYMRLATQGNPTVLTVLYAPLGSVLTSSPLGVELRVLAPQIVSVNAGLRFLGYLNGQRERMIGGGNQGRVPKRPELVALHGYDTKYASHALRLGLQGVELVKTGRLTLPLTGLDLAACMEVKRGDVDFTEALLRINSVRDELHRLLAKNDTVLHPEPDWDMVNDWMVYAHETHWGFQS